MVKLISSLYSNEKVLLGHLTLALVLSAYSDESSVSTALALSPVLPASLLVVDDYSRSQ